MSYWIALVGGGGKTTTMFHLAKHFFEQGKSVIVTTTTNIAKVESGDFGIHAEICLLGENVNFDAYFKKNEQREIKVIVSYEKDGKFKGISPKQCDALDGLADVILVEADGAKYLPIKVPMPHEPVLPRQTHEVLVCMGMDAIHKRVADVCFRFERAKELFGFSDENVLTEEDAAMILTSEHGGRKDVKEAKVGFVINKVDDEERLESAKVIKRWILEKMHECGIECSKECVYMTSYLEGEYYREITRTGAFPM